MTPAAILFFLVFAGINVGMYVAIRRRIGPPMLLAAGGVLGAVISMMLVSLAQDNLFAHALSVGVVLGGGLCLATLVIALYFQGNEMRSQHTQAQAGGEAQPATEDG